MITLVRWRPAPGTLRMDTPASRTTSVLPARPRQDWRVRCPSRRVLTVDCPGSKSNEYGGGGGWRYCDPSAGVPRCCFEINGTVERRLKQWQCHCHSEPPSQIKDVVPPNPSGRQQHQRRQCALSSGSQMGYRRLKPGSWLKPSHECCLRPC